MIKIDNINISYQNNVLIADSKLEIKNGIVTLICGKNGSGKTSLLYLIGLFHLNNCQYYIDDLLINDLNDEELSKLKRNYIGYVFQDGILFNNLRVIDYLKLYDSLSGNNISDEEINKLLKIVDLDCRILNQKISTLSGGERQRIAICLALCKNPQLLILDEPTSALDSETENSLFITLNKIAKEKKIAVIMVSHSLKAHKYSDVIYEITDHKINLVKDFTTNNKSITPNLNDIKPIDQNLFKKYHKLYNRNNFNHFIICFISILLLINGSFGSLILISASNQKQINEITKLSENQIF